MSGLQATEAVSGSQAVEEGSAAADEVPSEQLFVAASFSDSVQETEITPLEENPDRILEEAALQLAVSGDSTSGVPCEVSSESVEPPSGGQLALVSSESLEVDPESAAAKSGESGDRSVSGVPSESTEEVHFVMASLLDTHEEIPQDVSAADPTMQQGTEGSLQLVERSLELKEAAPISDQAGKDVSKVENGAVLPHLAAATEEIQNAVEPEETVAGQPEVADIPDDEVRTSN